eukprot:3140887-Amphidinium_carterae.1
MEWIGECHPALRPAGTCLPQLVRQKCPVHATLSKMGQETKCAFATKHGVGRKQHQLLLSVPTCGKSGYCC